MKYVFKSGAFLNAPKNYEIIGTEVKHYDTSSTVTCFDHKDANVPAVIIKPFVEAAFHLANGDVSIANINENNIYVECAMPNGNLCSMVLNNEDNTIKYEFDEDFENSSELWPLAFVILYRALEERMANELKTVYQNIRTQVSQKQNISSTDAFLLCDYINCRLTSKKECIDISYDELEKVRGINRLVIDGETIEIKEDITKTFTGKDGVFERLTCKSQSAIVEKNEPMLGQGKFLFGEDLSEEEKKLVQHVTGVVERMEYVDTLELLYDTKDNVHPMNNLFATGTSGSGKSFFSIVMSSEFGLPYMSLSANDDLGESTLKGVWKIGEDGKMYYEHSKFAKMIQRPCVIEIAESSAALATRLTQIYDLLDRDKMFLVNDDGVIIRRHPHAYIVFTCNTYACMNEIAPSLLTRSVSIMRLPMLDRDSIRKIILREIDNAPIDDDIMTNVLDCVDAIEDYLKSSSAPRGCESSMRSYSYWAYKIQHSRNHGRYNPIYAARTTLLPVISSKVNFDETFEQTIIDNIISPIFNFFENGGV